MLTAQTLALPYFLILTILLMYIIIILCISEFYIQEIINNFQVENSEIIWQKVFDTELTFEALTEKVKYSE